ncbi:FadR/GntR family transcriptional regulator [Rubellimicrobium roseum]|uniref:FadR family transcriptional regulator n=1 Tax=Rubellimicrobium roseum TaxID=687525 RepID=A0A5C4NR33_9RHOB|nr:FadR/GntR family transcriptional regulator [Rubellimicrobium roseum]TNC74859.1 FadR family transcriptional regulator [Rubellimicrobium roseum]
MSLPSLDTPIQRESVAEQVARRILDLVVARQLRPGDQLPPERDLAESLGVSRPSVREAIRGLSILGVVRSRQGGGSTISALDAQALLSPIQFFLALEEGNIRALYDARSLIESDVARRAAVNMDDASLDRLEGILAAQESTLQDATAFRASDFAFHQAIWQGCGNPFLRRIGESLNVLGLEVRKRASETAGVLEQSLRDHRLLLDALRARDPEAAARAAETHMQNVFRSTVGQEGT